MSCPLSIRSISVTCAPSIVRRRWGMIDSKPSIPPPFGIDYVDGYAHGPPRCRRLVGRGRNRTRHRRLLTASSSPEFPRLSAPPQRSRRPWHSRSTTTRPAAETPATAVAAMLPDNRRAAASSSNSRGRTSGTPPSASPCRGPRPGRTARTDVPAFLLSPRLAKHGPNPRSAVRASATSVALPRLHDRQPRFRRRS